MMPEQIPARMGRLVKLFNLGHNLFQFNRQRHIDLFMGSLPGARVENLDGNELSAQLGTSDTTGANSHDIIAIVSVEVFAHFEILKHATQFVDKVGGHAHFPKPIDHLLFLVVVRGGVENEAAGEVGLVELHKHVLVLHVFEHQNLAEPNKE